MNAWSTAGRQRPRLLFASLVDRSQEVVGEQRDVLAPLAQRRQRNRDDVQAVIQVLAELAFGDELLEIALGAGDGAHVHRHRSRAAHALDDAVLQHAQQLHLHRQRHLVHVVEEDGAAFGHLEAARAVLDGAGEGAALVAEELGLDERLGEDGAADGDERLVPPVAGLVNAGWR